MDRRTCNSGPLPPVERNDQRHGQAVTGSRPPWQIAIAVSLVLHILLAALLLDFVGSRQTGPPEKNPPGTVELLMVEQRGSGKPAAPRQPENERPAASARVPPAQKPQAQKPQAQKPPAQKPQAQASPEVNQSDQAATAPPTPTLPPTPDSVGEKVPLPAQTQTEQPTSSNETAVKPIPPDRDEATASEAPAQPSAPPKQQAAPVFNLEGTDSESNAIVMGDHVIPASPDDRFRNRPPIYPYDAAARGEHGAVVLVIHVSELGVSVGADVAVTSGVTSLDRAALDAVRKWHFRPAMKEGHAVPFDMPMRFVFEFE